MQGKVERKQGEKKEEVIKREKSINRQKMLLKRDEKKFCIPKRIHVLGM